MEDQKRIKELEEENKLLQERCRQSESRRIRTIKAAVALMGMVRKEATTFDDRLRSLMLPGDVEALRKIAGQNSV